MPARYVVHVSGDQRFVLFVNGQRVGVGPARGDIYFWRFETFDLAPHLKPGRNLLSALVWSFGTRAPGAQISARTGFVLQGDGTGEQAANTDATWQCAVEAGHQPWPEGARAMHEEAHQYFVVGPGERLDAAQYDWDWARLPQPGESGGRWKPAVAYDQPSPRTVSEGPGYTLTPEGRLLVPDELPPMEYRLVPAGAVVRASGARPSLQFPDAPLTVPPHTKASLLLDRKALVTAYPELAFSGGRGSRVRLTYQEALVADGYHKGNRDEITGKRMLGYSDEVVPDGGKGRVFHTLWWRTWRYLQLDAETGDEPLVIESLKAHATGYPFEAKGTRADGRHGPRPDPRGRLAHGAAVRARDVLRLPVLRAVPVRRRHADPGARLLHERRRRPPRPPGHLGVRALAPLGRHHVEPLPRRRAAVHPALLAAVDRDGARLLDVPRRPGVRARAAAGHARPSSTGSSSASCAAACWAARRGGTSSTGRPTSPRAFRRWSRTASRPRSPCSSWARCATPQRSSRRSATRTGPTSTG